jgi:tRNA 5-methylaminomethyl-2-thiouridine biosynthesis bifunctional protein
VDYRAHWRGRERFVVFDSGYGGGAAFEAVLAAWRADPQRPARLHYIALASVHDNTGDAHWENSLPAPQRIVQADARVTLDLLHAPRGQAIAQALAHALEQLDARLDAVCLHGLAQAGTGFVRPLARMSAPGTLLTGSNLTPAQIAALGAAGFACRPLMHEGQAAGQAGEQSTAQATPGVTAVFASRQPPAAERPQPERRAVVIGAGLAGSAACERLCARGWHVTLVERHAHAALEASGNLAGIYMPSLSKDDNTGERLSRAAFLFALAYWEKLGGIGGAIEGARCGVLQLARDPAHGRLQRQLAASGRYPREFAQWLEADAASALLGSNAPDGAWLFRHGGWARPASVCAAMLAACGARLETRFGTGSVTLGRDGGQWQVRDAQGAVVARAPVAVLANGTGANGLAQASTLPLAAVRGQVTHLAAGALRALPFVLCREAYLTPASHDIVSAGATYDQDGEGTLRAASQDENLGKIRALLSDGQIGLDAPLQGRVGFRSVAPDRLPLVGALPFDAAGRIERLRDVPRQPGLYGLLGYASRGLCWAPLAAELLAAQLEGEPLPLDNALARALDPGRFLLRERRRSPV